MGKPGHEKKQGQNKRAGTGQRGRDRTRRQRQERKSGKDQEGRYRTGRQGQHM
jgi:hypothetical protein